MYREVIDVPQLGINIETPRKCESGGKSGTRRLLTDDLERAEWDYSPVAPEQMDANNDCGDDQRGMLKPP